MLLPSLRLFALACALLFFSCTARVGKSGGGTSGADVAVLGFYNVENLFDADDDPDNPGDDEFSPGSDKAWTSARYGERLARTARAILDMGSEVMPGGPALVGLAEVENARVLRELIATSELSASGYDVLHYESPDSRGIDVGLIYRRAEFTPIYSAPLRVSLDGLADDGSELTTRDVLYVKGLLLGDTLHYFVNHWPSRRGGEEASRARRASAASVVRTAVDSIYGVQPLADIVIVGDLNDDPTDASVVATLRAAKTPELAAATGLYNPTVTLFREGPGTLGYRGAWNFFDQVIVSAGLAAGGGGWGLQEVAVLRKDYLLEAEGRFQGFPFRTYAGDRYLGGYSDHLPVYGIFTRPKA